MSTQWIDVTNGDGDTFNAWLALPPTGHGPGLVLAPGGRNLFVATHEDRLLWGLSARRETLPPGGTTGLAPDDLHALARQLTRRWHPRLRHLVE